jgi:Rps23 Pro-64 3,4-dihydroxylase Tpa1-like proline 4-hydroxylase
MTSVSPSHGAEVGVTSRGPLGVFDDPRYARIAVGRAKEYQSAAPFPNICIDDFLPEDVAHALSAAFPKHDDIMWIERDNKNNRRRYQHDETKLPHLLREMLREFNSRQFTLFLETLTGIDCLLPDPYFIGGGAHMSTTGDFLNVHADFNWHHKLQAYRRVNALLYLPEQWEPEWDGALEFWDKELTRPVVSNLPRFNRLVIFSTGEQSNHGQRLPNKCPSNVQRKVLNLYYYTTHREDGDVDDPHFTLYRSPGAPSETAHGEATPTISRAPAASDFAMGLARDYRKSGGSQVE